MDLAKLGNIVVDANVYQFGRAGNIIADANLASLMQKNVSESDQKHFCFLDTDFASKTNVS